MNTWRQLITCRRRSVAALAILAALVGPAVLSAWRVPALNDVGHALLQGRPAPAASAVMQHILLVMGLSIAVVSLVMAAYRRPLARRLIHVMFFFILLELFYRFAYGGPISSGLLLSVSETSRRETLELLAGHPVLTCSLSLVALFGLWALLASWNDGLLLPARLCVQGALLAAVLIAASLLLGYLRIGDWRSAGAAALPDIRATYPFDLAAAVSAVAVDSLDTHRRAADRARFKFANARLSPSPSARVATEIYVVIVGETSRRANWSLFGYPRPTTPRLDEIKQDLVLFDRISANATNTILSLPLVLSRATTATQEIARTEKSLVALLGQSGFDTYWISNQERSSATTNPIARIASDAEHVSFTDELRNEERDNGLDSNLSARFKETLQQLPANGKTVIFLHMEGSHFGYKDRYPESLTQFADSEAAPRVLPRRQLRLLNQYDNSIYFTDRVVRQVIDELAGCGCKSGLVYFSDHGERLFDNGLGDQDFGHGFPTVSRQEIDVPLFFWLSADYRTAYAPAVARLTANARSIGQLHNLFETIADLAGVDYDGREAALSLFSGDFKSPDQLDVLNMQQAAISLTAL